MAKKKTSSKTKEKKSAEITSELEDILHVSTNTIDESLGSIGHSYKSNEERHYVDEQLKLIMAEELKSNQSEWKHLQTNFIKISEKEYVAYIRHQGHGFLNYIVAQLLKVKGVEYAAYKITNIDDPLIYLHLDGSKDIKSVFKEAVKQMTIEMKGLKNAVQTMNI